MKRTRVTRLTLNNDLLEEEFFEEAALIGIVCTKKPHSFIWEVNRKFDVHFLRDHELEITKEDMIFPVYRYDNRLKQTEHYVFSNRKENASLLPEAKNIDYIWMIRSGSFLKHEKEVVINGLVHISGVDYFSEIDSTALKSRSFLVI